VTITDLTKFSTINHPCAASEAVAISPYQHQTITIENNQTLMRHSSRLAKLDNDGYLSRKSPGPRAKFHKDIKHMAQLYRHGFSRGKNSQQSKAVNSDALVSGSVCTQRTIMNQRNLSLKSNGQHPAPPVA
jgi:hypothetical protein